ncbi:MAG: type I-U CRISPR-associated helicase/endonuclease Cas3 [Acidimicrobiaceae bacterium]|nr:type I-U CRISPR-associated helicase/endonuclease Cas3 [Acidimicrobiaceae bacterium]MDE0493964.1 type I-U CRISPR-associated helicase/endonuclease Cas3 [Acidimicrobiaceae bacterium]
MSPAVPACPPFGDWYRQINGRDPFPWQQRLADTVAAADGCWPEQIGIPTGLGKTACVDVAVWALARQADLDPLQRTAPTRIWWVVNRRLLVDDTYSHARKVAEKLRIETDSGSAMGAVAARLRSLSAAPGPPLEALRLRGGDAHNRPRHPAQPAVICSTVPMFGSRLLFRGYGSSRSMRPIDAALAGTDSLVLIDEAHLARHLMELVSSAARLSIACGGLLPTARSSPQVVALTATGDPASSAFDLEADDHAHPEVTRRLDASKALTIACPAPNNGPPPAHKSPAIAKMLASLAGDLIAEHASPEHATALVFANTPASAVATAEILRRDGAMDVIVATGRTRGDESEATASEIARRLRPARTDSDTNGRALAVVATQTLEVGADLDADYLVTEACGTRALIQRLGRLNRFGRRHHARAVYVPTSPDKDGNWPVYGQEPASTLQSLEDAAAATGTVDASPRNIRSVLGSPAEPEGRAPALAAGLLQEWAKTTNPPPGEAPPEPYFSGIADPGFDVHVVWRVHLPEPGQRIWPRVSENEIVAVPASEAAVSLQGCPYIRLSQDQTAVEAPSSGGRQDMVLRPGDTVVVAARTGKIDEDGHWNPNAASLARDVSLTRHGLPLAQDVLDNLYTSVPSAARSTLKPLFTALRTPECDDPAAISQAVASFCDVLMQHTPDAYPAQQWQDFIAALANTTADRHQRGLPSITDPSDEVPRLPISTPGTSQTRFDEHDELSMATPVTLGDHGDDTACVAACVADSCGIPAQILEVVRTAALLHDIGKADQRFQAWLEPAGSPHALAKSATAPSQWQRTRAASGWPRGGRHEELSRRLVQAWVENDACDFDDNERTLLQHLVVSHHGRGRPLVAPVEDHTGTTVSFDVGEDVVTASADLSVTDWDQPARFAMLNELYGCWGLALLEAIVRQSDHIASAAEDQRWEIR